MLQYWSPTALSILYMHHMRYIFTTLKSSQNLIIVVTTFKNLCILYVKSILIHMHNRAGFIICIYKKSASLGGRSRGEPYSPWNEHKIQNEHSSDLALFIEHLLSDGDTKAYITEFIDTHRRRYTYCKNILIT